VLPIVWPDLALGDTPDVVIVVHCWVSTSSLKSSPDNPDVVPPPKDHSAPSEPATIVCEALGLGLPIDHGLTSGYLRQDRSLDAETLPVMRSSNTRATSAKDDTQVAPIARSCFTGTPSEF
jgi:hypothetical protein